MIKVIILGILLAMMLLSLGGCFWGVEYYDRDHGYYYPDGGYYYYPYDGYHRHEYREHHEHHEEHDKH